MILRKNPVVINACKVNPELYLCAKILGTSHNSIVIKDYSRSDKKLRENERNLINKKLFVAPPVNVIKCANDNKDDYCERTKCFCLDITGSLLSHKLCEKWISECSGVDTRGKRRKQGTGNKFSQELLSGVFGSTVANKLLRPKKKRTNGALSSAKLITPPGASDDFEEATKKWLSEKNSRGKKEENGIANPFDDSSTLKDFKKSRAKEQTTNIQNDISRSDQGDFHSFDSLTDQSGVLHRARSRSPWVKPGLWEANPDNPHNRDHANKWYYHPRSVAADWLSGQIFYGAHWAVPAASVGGTDGFSAIHFPSIGSFLNIADDYD
uniref:Thyroglobulin type-1 domain-containing protein n=1 Tax=Rhabditophanes sp. KR3021 TaxID=114890 RepID=A0AC35TZH1_9BILA